MTEKPRLTPDNVHDALIWVIRLASIWEAGRERTDTGMGHDFDETTLRKFVELFLSSVERDVPLVEGKDDRVVRRRDFLLPPLYRAFEDVLKRAADKKVSAENAIKELVKIGRAYRDDLNETKVWRRIWLKVKGDFPAETHFSDFSEEEVLEKFWKGRLDRPTGYLFKLFAGRDSRFAQDADDALNFAVKDTLLPRLEESKEGDTANGVTTDDIRDLVRLKLEASSRGSTAGSLPPLTYLLCEVLGYPTDRVREAARMLDSGTCVVEHEDARKTTP